MACQARKNKQVFLSLENAHCLPTVNVFHSSSGALLPPAFYCCSSHLKPGWRELKIGCEEVVTRHIKQLSWLGNKLEMVEVAN